MPSTINGGGYFTFEDDNNYVTLIRLINSTEDAQPLGYMFINISVNSLLSFAREDETNYSDFCVSAGSETILPFLNDDLNLWLKNSPADSLYDKNVIRLGHERYLLLKFQTSGLDWNYIAAINYNLLADQNRAFIIISLILLLISSVFFVLIALGTNKFVTAPISQLMKAMKKSETGNFNHANVTPYHDEIGQLQNAYNDMVDKIQQLLVSKVTEQKKLRKAELSVLQEQIKPHFLYNSLGAISYLVTSQQNEKAYDLIISLSEYYRDSLSKGNEIIPLSTEIGIVKNYLKLQKVRFPEIFNDEYEIQGDVLSYKIPRLILQPLVENSLYHGIIPTCDYGMIKICIYADGEYLIIRVSDNGIGMTQAVLDGIRMIQPDNSSQSFGLKGTIERMQIFYEIQDICTIDSKPNKGTTITFSIPLNRTEKQDE